MQPETYENKVIDEQVPEGSGELKAKKEEVQVALDSIE